jgi:transposase, IS5 family
MTDDFFRARLEQMIDLKHPLAVLAQRMPWAQIEKALLPCFAAKNREGKQIEGSDPEVSPRIIKWMGKDC